MNSHNKPVLNSRLGGIIDLITTYLSDLSFVKLEVCSAGGKVITSPNEHWIEFLQRHYSAEALVASVLKSVAMPQPPADFVMLGNLGI